MKNILIVVFCLLTLGLTAQDRKQKREEKIESLKIAFITDAIDLSPEQAEKFWPIYNEAQDKQKELRKKIRALAQIEDENISETEAQEILEQFQDLEIAILANKQEQIKNLEKVISNKQIIKLINSKDRFKKEILDGLNRRRRKK